MSQKFDLNERLNEARERSVGVQMPVPLHERVDQLCDLLHDTGHRRPSKREMLSALVLAAPTDADELEAMLRAYHGAYVRDALVAESATGDVVEFPRRRSGPRSGRSPRG
jgi:hypothetical protein